MFKKRAILFSLASTLLAPSAVFANSTTSDSVTETQQSLTSQAATSLTLSTSSADSTTSDSVTIKSIENQKELASQSSEKTIEQFLLQYASEKNTSSQNNSIGKTGKNTSIKKLNANSDEYYVFLNNLFWDTDTTLEKLPNFEQVMDYAYNKLMEKSYSKDTPKNHTTETQENMANATAVQAAAVKYDRTAAVNYAKKWAKSGDKARNGIYPYFDLACTNFASQVVQAGGMTQERPFYIPSGYNLDNNYWYATNLKDGSKAWSASWSIVDHFQTYWKNESKTVTAVSHSNLKTIIERAELGDIIQYKAKGSSRPTHSMVVTKKANGTIYLTYHTGPDGNDVVDNDIKKISEKDTWYLVKF